MYFASGLHNSLLQHLCSKNIIVEEYVYILDEDVPLASPQTSDVSCAGAGLTVLMTAAAAAYWVKQTKKDETVD